MLIIRLAVSIFAFILLQLQCIPGDGSVSIDGSFPLKNGTITKITDYNRMDQCMAQPGYFHVHHNSLVIFLQDHEFCGGGPHGEEGLLICHKGQLDEKETMPRGLKPNRQFKLSNEPGNAVAKRCEEAGHPDWHGILIYTDDQGQWVIKFSTTNRTFVIPKTGSELRTELLFYKLASAKDGGESFLSKTFGPKRDFMEWDKRDGFGVAEEAANRIRQPENEQLKKLFMELVKHQALMRNYVGIWSLGLDMLPTDENVYHLDLYTEKSECCKNIQVFFNLPTAEYPEPKKEAVDFKEGPIIMDGNFVENFNGTLDGVVKENAKNLSFELVDLFHPDDKDQGMRLIVNFDENGKIIFERMENKIWKTNRTTHGFKYHFAAGVAFHLFFIMRKNDLIVNMNCYGPVQLNATGGGIDFKNIHRIKIDGDYQLTKEFAVDTYHLDNSWMLVFDNQTVFGISAKNSSGIVLRGKVNKNAKKFSIKLWNKGEDGFFESILELEVGISTPGFKISNGSKNDAGLTLPAEKLPKYSEESPFEALIQFKENGTFDIWMNNSHIDQYTNPAGLRVVNYVQILDDALGDMNQLLKMPITCDYEMSSSNKKSLEIFGKMLPSDEKTSFKIELKTVNNFTQLQMDFKFDDATPIIIVDEFFSVRKGSNQARVADQNLKMGEFLAIKISYKTLSNIGLSINVCEEHLVIATKNFEVTSKYMISGDFILEKLNLNITESCM